MYATLRRYLRTVALFWHAAVAAEMEYRLNFAMAAVSSLMVIAGAVFTLYLLFQHGGTLGGWTWPEALIVVALFTILEGMQSTFLSPNRVQISEFVRDGTLDFVLLKPIDSQFWLSVRKVSVWGVPRILVGLGLLFIAGARVESPLTPLDYVRGLVPLAMGFAVIYSLGYLLSTLCIWYVKLFNITMAMQGLLEAGRFPIAAYPAAYRVFFTFVLPVAFMTTVPAQVMLDKPNTGRWIVAAAAVAVGLFLASRAFWRFALGSYTSASS